MPRLCLWSCLRWNSRAIFPRVKTHGTRAHEPERECAARKTDVAVEVRVVRETELKDDRAKKSAHERCGEEAEPPDLPTEDKRERDEKLRDAEVVVDRRGRANADKVENALNLHPPLFGNSKFVVGEE